MSLNIGVVGAGICGLTIGRLLQEQGHEVTLFDRNEKNIDGGAGIVIAPNGLQVLRQLGLLEPVQAAGAVITCAGLKTFDGKSLSKLDLKKIVADCDLSSVGIQRSRLHRILSHGLESKVQTSMTVASVKESSDCVTLDFTCGKVREFDYVIGADGLHSAVRAAVLGRETLRSSGTFCWRGIASRRTIRSFLNAPEEFFEYWGRGSRFGYCALNDDDIYWFAVLKSADLHHGQPWQNSFSSYVDGIPELIAATPADRIIERQIEDRLPVKRWHTQRIVLCGDAIHPTTPNMGQGACMALESSVVLVKEICKQGFGSAAFESYQNKRIERTKMVTNTSYRIGKIGHWSNPLSVWLRNQMLRMSPSPAKQLKKLYLVDL